MALTLAELAQRLNAELRGNPEHRVEGVASPERANERQLAFIAGEKRSAALDRCRAGAVLLKPELAARHPGNTLVVSNPHLSFARAAALLHPDEWHAPGIAPGASVDAAAHLAPSAWIGPNCIIEAGAVIGEQCQVGPGSHVAAGARVGERTRLVARVYVGPRCEIGARAVIHPGAVIGSDGFGFAKDGERWIKVPQLGRVILGDDVEVGANTTIDRGALDDTVIGNGVKLDNLIQIAHNVRIGDHTAIAAQVGIAGSAVIGKRCTIGGQAGIIGHLEIADDVHVTATTLVTGDLKEPGSYASNLKAAPVQEWRRIVARLMQLDTLARRLRQIEEKLK